MKNENNNIGGTEGGGGKGPKGVGYGGRQGERLWDLSADGLGGRWLAAAAGWLTAALQASCSVKTNENQEDNVIIAEKNAVSTIHSFPENGNSAINRNILKVFPI